MNTKDMIKIMQDYVDGKTIEVQTADNKWESVGIKKQPNWDWSRYTYRVKPEAKYRPYKSEELIQLKGKWLKSKHYQNSFLITGYSIKDGCVFIGEEWVSRKELLEYWTNEDGSPCGMLCEE